MPIGVSSAELAGREAEMATLRGALLAAEAGRPSVTLLSGEAGVGKTRLAREVARLAADRDMLTLRGECMALGGGEFPYAPLAAALRDAPSEVIDAALDELPGRARAELARVFPHLIDTSATTPAAEAARPEQSHVFGCLFALFEGLSRVAPVQLTVEDLHWADASTRDFLLFLVLSLRSERLAVLATIRGEEVPRDHPVRPLLVRIGRSEYVNRLELRPLTLPGVERQVAGIVGASPAPELVARLFQRAEGNPFFTEELLAAASDEHDLLPDSLRDTLLLRVDRLPADAQRVMRAAAVAGRPADAALLQAVAELDAEAASGALRTCIEHHVLRSDSAGGRYAVRHALLAEAVYGDLMPAERAQLHLGVVDALERGAGATSAAERARHLEGAGDGDAALGAWLEAAGEAERAFAYKEALAHFERADALWGEADRAPPLDRVDLLARAAEAARWSGDFDRARALCQRALDAFDHAADPVRAAALYERLGRYAPWNVGAALAAYDQALSLLPEDRVAERMKLRVNEAFALTFVARWQKAKEKAEEALACARGEETIAEEGAARSVLGVAVAFLGDALAGERHLRRALELAEQGGNRQDLAQVHADLGEVLRLQGRIEDAHEVMVGGEQLAARIGAEGTRGFMAANAAHDLLRLGRWRELAVRLAELDRRPLMPTAELLVAITAGQLDAAQGRIEAARARFARAIELCEEGSVTEFVPAVYSGAALLELVTGDVGAARRHVATGIDALDGEDVLYVPVLYAAAARVEADAGEGARSRGEAVAAARAGDAARGYLDTLARLLAAGEAAVVPPEAEAHLASARAEAARARGEATAEPWAVAVALWRERRDRYRLAYAAYRQGEAELSSSGGRDRARSVLDEASRLCGELEAAGLEAEIRSLARRARIALGPSGDTEPAPEAESRPFDLTEREAEVLALIGEGLTNRQISERLYISPHTAGVHVSHILAKLDVPNRVLAAGVAERLGLVSAPEPPNR